MKEKSLRPLDIFLMGPPGCGKDTQGEKLSEKFSAASLVMSAEIDKVATEEELEDKAKGIQLPDERVFSIWLSATERLAHKSAIVHNGPLRRIIQAEKILNRVSMLGHEVIVINIETPEIICRERCNRRDRYDVESFNLRFEHHLNTIDDIENTVLSMCGVYYIPIKDDGKLSPEEIFTLITKEIQKS